MPRYTKAKLEELQQKAKDLYLKDFNPETIADLLKVAVTTVEKWMRQGEFEKAKQSQIIALSEIRQSILESYADVLDGKTPRITPDAAVKYAKAFEQFSSKKQVLTYIFEGFELLTDVYQLKIQETKRKQDKEIALNELKHLRQAMEEVINKLTKEVFGDD